VTGAASAAPCCEFPIEGGLVAREVDLGGLTRPTGRLGTFGNSATIFRSKGSNDDSEGNTGRGFDRGRFILVIRDRVCGE